MHVYMYKKKAKTEGEGAQPVELSVTAAQIVSLSPFGKRKKKKKSRCFPASKMCRKAEGFEWTNPEILVAL